MGCWERTRGQAIEPEAHFRASPFWVKREGESLAVRFQSLSAKQTWPEISCALLVFTVKPGLLSLGRDRKDTVRGEMPKADANRAALDKSEAVIIAWKLRNQSIRSGPEVTEQTAEPNENTFP